VLEQKKMKKKIIISNIVLLGLVSLFIDMSTEMVYPLIPLFLTTTLGATPAIVGIIEGLAESTAALLKVFSGYIGDIRQNKKKLTLIGYSASLVYKVLLILATSWVGVLVARIVDRTGKGIRVAPRDALVAQSSSRKKLGSSFGLHKMLDMAGSAAGAGLALLFTVLGFTYQTAFFYAIIPAVIGILIIPAIRENKEAPAGGERLSLKGLRLDSRLWQYLAVIFLFCLGNSSNAFLLLKAQSRGFSVPQVMLLYLIFNTSASLLAFPAGKLSDRIGRSRVLVPGYLVYGLVYIGFAVLSSQVSVALLFLAYGAFTALTSGAERAFIAEASPPQFRGTVLGLYGMLQGVALLLASIIAGVLWDTVSPDAPFWFGGCIGLVCAAAIAIILRENKSRHSIQAAP
jgi:MFS family permease